MIKETLFDLNLAPVSSGEAGEVISTLNSPWHILNMVQWDEAHFIYSLENVALCQVSIQVKYSIHGLEHL